jgi:hypothetical protein
VKFSIISEAKAKAEDELVLILMCRHMNEVSKLSDVSHTISESTTIQHFLLCVLHCRQIVLSIIETCPNFNFLDTGLEAACEERNKGPKFVVEARLMAVARKVAPNMQ